MIPAFSQYPRRRSSRQQQQQSSLASEDSRSRSLNSSSHHHHHHNHHHQHFHHHHHLRPRVSRTQDPSFQLQGNSVNPPIDENSSSSTRPTDSADVNVRSRDLLMQRRLETDAHRVALEARGRLDERLREAAFRGRRNSANSLPRLAQHYFNALFSDEDEAASLMWEDEQEWEASLSHWLAGRVPRALRETLQPDWMDELPATTRLRGLSKAAVSALPREVYEQKWKAKQEGEEGEEEEQVDCSVCLEEFVGGETLVCLPCKHKFHPACLTPWLESHEQCPYCRAQVVVSEGNLGLKAGGGGGGGLNRTEVNLLDWLESFETGIR